MPNHILFVCGLVSLTGCGGGSAVQQVAGGGNIAPMEILTNGLTDARVGQSYSYHMISSGGNPPYNWSLALGGLPPGIALDAKTGLLAGIPTRAGTFSFTLEVTDSTFAGRGTAMQSLSLAVETQPLSILTPALPDGKVGEPYDIRMEASGGTLPYTWSVLDGSLAAGVSLNPLTGEIAGTPTEAGTSLVTIQVMDSSSPQNVARLMIGEAGPNNP